LVEGKRLPPKPPAGAALVGAATPVDTDDVEADDWPPRVKPPMAGAGLLAAGKRLDADVPEVALVALWP